MRAILALAVAAVCCLMFVGLAPSEVKRGPIHADPFTAPVVVTTTPALEGGEFYEWYADVDLSTITVHYHPAPEQPAEEYVSPPPPPMRSIEIVVLGDGVPIPNAEVVALEKKFETDSAGTVRIETRDTYLIQVNAEAPGYLWDSKWIRHDDERVIFRMEQSARLEGRVLMPSGAPAAAAVVYVFGAGVHRKPFPTDENGRFAAFPLSVRRAFVVARMPGRGPIAIDVDIEPGDNRCELRFTEGGSVSGRVFDESGKPKAGVAIRLAPSGTTLMSEPWPPQGGWRRSRPFANAVTDADGGYEIHGVPLPYAVVVFATREGKAVGRSRPVYLTAERPRAVQDVTFDSLVDLRIRIEFADKTAVRVATFHIDGEDRLSYLRRFKKDEDGWTTRSLAPGDYTLTAWPEDALPIVSRIKLQPGPTRTVVLNAKPGATLAGRLLDTRGRPIPNYPIAFVEAESGRTTRDPGQIHPVAGQTDEQGRFVIHGLRPVNGRIAGDHPFNYNPTPHSAYAGSFIDNVRPGGAPRDYRLPELGIVRGRIQPGPDSVTIWYRGADVGGSFSVDVDEGGAFEFRQKWPNLDLRIGDSPNVYVALGVSVRPGAIRDLGLLSRKEFSELRGRARGPDGVAVTSGTAFVVSRHRHGTPSTGLDAKGEFVLTHVPRGRITLRIWSEQFGSQPFTVDVRDGMGPQTFVLKTAVRLRLTLIDTSGIPVADRWIVIEDSSSTASFGRTDPNGVFEDKVAPGKLTVLSGNDEWTVTTRAGSTHHAVLRTRR